MAQFNKDQTIDMNVVVEALRAVGQAAQPDGVTDIPEGYIPEWAAHHGIPRLLDGQTWLIDGVLFNPVVDPDAVPAVVASDIITPQTVLRMLQRHGPLGFRELLGVMVGTELDDASASATAAQLTTVLETQPGLFRLTEAGTWVAASPEATT